MPFQLDSTMVGKTGIIPEGSQTFPQTPDPRLDLQQVLMDNPAIRPLFSEDEISNIYIANDPKYRFIQPGDFNNLVEGKVSSYRTREFQHPDYYTIDRLMTKTFARDNGKSPVDIAFSIAKKYPNLESEYQDGRLFLRSKSNEEFNTNPWHPFEPKLQNIFEAKDLGEAAGIAKEYARDALEFIPMIAKGAAAYGMGRAGALNAMKTGATGPMRGAVGATAMGSLTGNSALALMGKNLGYRKELGEEEIIKEAATDSIFNVLTNTGIGKPEVKALVDKMSLPEIEQRLFANMKGGRYTAEFTGRKAREKLVEQYVNQNQGLTSKIYSGVTRGLAPQVAATIGLTNAENLKTYLRNPEEVALFKQDPIGYIGKIGREALFFTEKAKNQTGKEIDNMREFFNSKDLNIDYNDIINFWADKIHKSAGDASLPFSGVKKSEEDFLKNTWAKSWGAWQDAYGVQGREFKDAPLKINLGEVEKLRNEAQTLSRFDSAVRSPSDSAIAGHWRDFYTFLKEKQMSAMEEFGDKTLAQFPDKIIKDPLTGAEKVLSPGKQFVNEYEKSLAEYEKRTSIHNNLKDILPYSPTKGNEQIQFDYDAFGKLMQNNVEAKDMLARIDDSRELFGELKPWDKGLFDKLNIAHSVHVFDPHIAKVYGGLEKSQSEAGRNAMKVAAQSAGFKSATGAGIGTVLSHFTAPRMRNYSEWVYNKEKAINKLSSLTDGTFATPLKESVKLNTFKRAPYGANDLFDYFADYIGFNPPKEEVITPYRP